MIPFCAHCGGLTAIHEGVDTDRVWCSCGVTPAGRAKIAGLEDEIEMTACAMSKYHDELDAARQRIAELESQIESHAWEISPAMAQAKLDEQNRRISELETKLDALATTSKSVIAGLEAQLRDAKLELKRKDQTK